MDMEIALIVEASLVALAVILFVFEVFIYLGEVTFRGKPMKGLKKE